MNLFQRRFSAAALFLLFTLPQAVRAQEPGNLKLAYSATILYPGVRGGFEHPVKQITRNIPHKNRPEKHLLKQRLWSLELGYYHHPDFHDNLYLTAGWVMRRRWTNGFFVEFSPAIGYSRTFLGGETYVIDDKTREIHLLKAAGYNYAILTIGGGMGKFLNKRTGIFFRPNLLLMYPSNNIIYLRPTIECGILHMAPYLRKKKAQ